MGSLLAPPTNGISLTCNDEYNWSCSDEDLSSSFHNSSKTDFDCVTKQSMELNRGVTTLGYWGRGREGERGAQRGKGTEVTRGRERGSCKYEGTKWMNDSLKYISVSQLLPFS